MEVSGLGSAYLDSAVLDNFHLSSASKTPDFNEIFERARKQELLSANQNTGSENKVSGSSARKPIDKTDKLYELCLELETFIIKNLLNGMRNTVQKSGLIDDSYAGKLYEDMLYDEYAKDFTKNANFGLAEQAYRQLKRLY